MSLGLLIQARMNSSRLPGKCLLDLEGRPILDWVVSRCQQAKLVDRVAVVTSTHHRDDEIADWCRELKILCYRGSENDVLDRYYQAARLMQLEKVIRVTADCPLIDPEAIDRTINYYHTHDYDYVYTTSPDPPEGEFTGDGTDVEVTDFESLEWLHTYLDDDPMREHAFAALRHHRPSFFYRQPYHCRAKVPQLSVDTPNDLATIRNLVSRLGPNFGFQAVLDLLETEPELVVEMVSGSEGRGQQLYARAKKLIPGGTQLLSKRPELYHPTDWPVYYSKVEGITVTDLDGRKYRDMCYNGIGSCILGANDPDVNRAVFETITRGTMSTLNHPSEIEIAEEMCRIHPWAGGARQARTGGEACSIAVRIARAHTGKDTIAVCGYHGWHDWYLATNLGSKGGLDQHLLKGLSPRGVPEGLSGTIRPFHYNRLDELEEVVADGRVGTIIMEPQRSAPPENEFLQRVREIADRIGAVLIFDEITSGFRINCGGIHLMYGVNPDLAVFGKALSNGFPYSIVIGRSEVIESASRSFISSTYWTESIGPTAALATLKKYREHRVDHHLVSVGEEFQARLCEVAQKTGVALLVDGLPSLTSFAFDYPAPLNYQIKTWYNGQMLRRGFLASTSLYLTYAHRREDIDDYLTAIEEVFTELKEKIDRGDDFPEETVASGFARLT